MESKLLLLIILFSFSLLFHSFQVEAQDPILELCSNSENYTSNSQFQTNLNLLLQSLRSNGTENGFFNTSTGGGSDPAYGLVQCRGDVSMEDCQTCLNNITVEITRRCPGRKDATLKYDDCVLRYSNQRFFSQVDSSRWWAAFNLANITDANIDSFNQQLGGLMNNLSDTAASRPNRYDSGSVEYTSFGNIYGMVQCNGDLSPTGCRSCLQSRISWIPNCCNSKQGARIYSTTCEIRYEIYPFVENEPVSPPPPPPVTTSPPETTNNTNNTEGGNGNGKDKSTIVVAIVVPVISSVLLLAICALFVIRRRKSKRNTRPEIIYERDDIGSEDSLQFDLDTIKRATNDFSDANKLGQGGFGAVYKGELLDGQEIAVKRLSKNSGQGSQEFKNEVILLHKLQHRNLVRLLGFCLAGEEKLLIYEFVPNTSLDKYIFDRTKSSLLDWERRYKIIGGIARGLLYLHEDSRLRIIHRDLKCGNILLDAEMNAKIADFGMARLFGVDQTQGNTSKIAGTFGYMAPEYALHGLFSVKSDVYSFGVLLLEIISGQKTNNFNRSGPSRDLLSYTWKLWRDDNALQLMDPILVDSYSANEVIRCIHIGLLCVQDDLEKRPTMSSVVLMLSSYSLALESPFAPAFLLDMRTGRDNAGSDVESNDSTTNSLVYSLDKPSSIKEV